MPNSTNKTTSFTYIRNLTCSDCGKEYASDAINTYCPDCQAPLLANYDLAQLRQILKPAQIAARPRGMWRWHELLPVQRQSNCVTLGEGDSALLKLPHFSQRFGIPNLLLKDESNNPSGSFKARGISAAISKAKELGVTKVIIPATGYAGQTLAVYAARAGMQCCIFAPKTSPAAALEESRLAGAEIVLVDGLISEAAGLAGEKARAEGWFDLSTFKEPYRLEGKKIIGYELAEALNWTLPDVIIYPTGGGAGLVGLWKAFDELEALGWLKTTKRPRLVAVQAKGCAPIVKAARNHASFCDFWTNGRTIASGLCAPKSFADQLILRDLYESQGTAVAVSDEAILSTQRLLSEADGIFPSLEGAATLAALIKLIQQKWIQPAEQVVLFNTGAGLKDIAAAFAACPAWTPG